MPLCLWMGLICCPVHPESTARRSSWSTLHHQLRAHLDLSWCCFPASRFCTTAKHWATWTTKILLCGGFSNRFSSCVRKYCFPSAFLQAEHGKVRASGIDGNDVTIGVTIGVTRGLQPTFLLWGTAQRDAHAADPSSRVTALGDGGGPGMVRSQELTRAPPHRCGMEQSLEALVSKERDFTSWWQRCWKQWPFGATVAVLMCVLVKGLLQPTKYIYI